MPRPLLLGHRGSRALKSIPENTFASFDRALADGCDGFEFDVRRTADGYPIICHDPTCNGFEIAASTAEQLPNLARLKEILKVYGDAFLDIELKVSGLESITAELVRRYPPRRGFVISSFLPEVLHAAHATDPRLPLGIICETKGELRDWRQLPSHYVICHYKLVSKTLIAEVHAAKQKLLAWTVNAAQDMTLLAHWGVDGLISDKTELMCNTISGQGE